MDSLHCRLIHFGGSFFKLLCTHYDGYLNKPGLGSLWLAIESSTIFLARRSTMDSAHAS